MAQYQPTFESIDTRPLPSWYLSARFGIFVHFGVYSVPSYRRLSPGRCDSYAEWYYVSMFRDGADWHNKTYGENYEYRNFVNQFKCELFDAKEWANLFASSGAKYVVLTSKHHDGYCLWPTESPFKANWNSMTTGPMRDIVGEVSAAVRERGLRMGLYYSVIEWETNISARAGTPTGHWLPLPLIQKYGLTLNHSEYVVSHLIPQLTELVYVVVIISIMYSLKYKPDILWGDGGEWDHTTSEWKMLEYLSWLYSSSPVKDDVVVNDRFGNDMMTEHGDFLTSEYSDAATSISSTSLPSSAGFLGAGQPTRANGRLCVWEESQGMGLSYGYNRIDVYKSVNDILMILVRVVSQGGNFLLNVGPSGDGRIPEVMKSRLLSIGTWMSVNGEAIYDSVPWSGTRNNPPPSNGINSVGPRDVFFTVVESRGLYAIVSGWRDEPIRVVLTADQADQLSDVTLLGYNDDKIVWNCPSKRPVPVNVDMAPVPQPVLRQTEPVKVSEQIRYEHYCIWCKSREQPLRVPCIHEERGTQYDAGDYIMRKRMKDESSLTSDDVEDTRERITGHVRRRRPRHSMYENESDKSIGRLDEVDEGARSDSEQSDVALIRPRTLPDTLSDVFERMESEPRKGSVKRSASALCLRSKHEYPSESVVCPSCGRNEWLLLKTSTPASTPPIPRVAFDIPSSSSSYPPLSSSPPKQIMTEIKRDSKMKTRSLHSHGVGTVAVAKRRGIPTRSPQKNVSTKAVHVAERAYVPLVINFPKTINSELVDLMGKAHGVYVFKIAFSNVTIPPVLSMHALEVSDKMSVLA